MAAAAANARSAHPEGRGPIRTGAEGRRAVRHGNETRAGAEGRRAKRQADEVTAAAERAAADSDADRKPQRPARAVTMRQNASPAVTART